MSERSHRLRIHPVALVLILLGLGGSAVATYLATGPDDPPWTDALPWEEVNPFEGVTEVIQARLAVDSTAYALVNGKPAGIHADVASFYRARQFAPAWTDSTARDTLVELLRGTVDVGLNPANYYASALSRTTGSLKGDSVDTLADQDLLLTSAVFELADDLSGPRVNVDSLYGSVWFATRRTLRPDTLLAIALAAPNPAEAVAQAIDQLHPQHPEYRALREMVARQRALIELEDWPSILPGRVIAPGDTSALVPTVRERMDLEGTALPYPTGPNRMIYDEGLASAVRAFQEGQGLEPDGVISRATREALNARPSGENIPLMTLNLERWRWLQDDLGSIHVLVNIPAFELAVRERTGTTYTDRLRMSTVVGKAAWETPVFSDTMTQIVFNPTWTIPASIQMESYGRVRPGGMVREPGPGNPLGRVKFLFPNDHAIYIHDTPSRWAFSQNRRAYSHGCIRAQEPERLAEEILTRSNGWAVEDVAAKFDGPWRLQGVNLDQPVPVHLVYFTAWVDDDGRLQTYRDVYGHDVKLADALGIDIGSPG